jgi:hypothetical protein
MTRKSPSRSAWSSGTNAMCFIPVDFGQSNPAVPKADPRLPFIFRQ